MYSPGIASVMISEDEYRRLLVLALSRLKGWRNGKLNPREKKDLEAQIASRRLPSNCMLAIVGKPPTQEPEPKSSEEAPKLEVISETPTTTEQDEPKNSS